MNESLINSFLHSRAATVMMALLALAGALFALAGGHVSCLMSSQGIVILSPDQWFPQGGVSFAVNMIVVVMIAVMSITINKQFNTMRSLSSLFAGLFMVMELGFPLLLAGFGSGTLLAAVFVAVSMLLFSVYQNPGNPQRVFLAFFLLSAGMLCQYAFMLYLPVLLTGMAQMRIFNLRNLMAAFLGTVTPIWILMGFGLVTPDDFYMPQISFIWKIYSEPTLLTIFVTALLTAFLGVLFIMLNFIRILSYNSRIRAVNGFLMVSMIATIVFTLIDFNNVATYMPLLNWLVAYQAGHFFATSTNRRSYIGVLVLIAIYLGLYGWNISI